MLTNKLLLLLLHISCLFLVSGCSAPYKYKSGAESLSLGKTIEYYSTQEIAVIYKYKFNQDVIIHKPSLGNSFAVNYDECGEVAKNLVANELKKKGVKIIETDSFEDDSKSLVLNVEKISSEVGRVGFSVEIWLRCDVGNGYGKIYIGNGSSAMVANFNKLVDEAIVDAVTKIINDPNIYVYLK